MYKKSQFVEVVSKYILHCFSKQIIYIALYTHKQNTNGYFSAGIVIFILPWLDSRPSSKKGQLCIYLWKCNCAKNTVDYFEIQIVIKKCIKKHNTGAANV